jgi:hypothetical protein
MKTESEGTPAASASASATPTPAAYTPTQWATTTSRAFLSLGLKYILFYHRISLQKSPLTQPSSSSRSMPRNICHTSSPYVSVERVLIHTGRRRISIIKLTPPTTPRPPMPITSPTLLQSLLMCRCLRLLQLPLLPLQYGQQRLRRQLQLRRLHSRTAIVGWTPRISQPSTMP